MRRLLAPRWIAAHLVVLVAAPAFVMLGFWQLSRHDERAVFNEAVQAGLDGPVVSLHSLAPFDERAAFRRVRAEGTWGGPDVLLGPRVREGVAGYHVLTPLVLGDGTEVIVDRGWVGYEVRPPLPAEAQVRGPVTVSGVWLPDEATGRFVTVPEEGTPHIVSGRPSAALGERLGRRFLPGGLLLEEPAALTPIPAAAPLPDQGPHLSYAVQWFLFALVVVVGYPLALRRVVRHPSGSVIAPDELSAGRV